MTWMRVTLSTDDITANRHGQLQDAFEVIWMAALAPKDAGMFQLSSPTQYDYYFSPKAAKMARALLAPFKPESCPAPAWGDLTVLVADAAFDWESALQRNAG